MNTCHHKQHAQTLISKHYEIEAQVLNSEKKDDFLKMCLFLQKINKNIFLFQVCDHRPTSTCSFYVTEALPWRIASLFATALLMSITSCFSVFYHLTEGLPCLLFSPLIGDRSYLTEKNTRFPTNIT